LFVNSDGKNSTPQTNKVNCSLLPQVNKFCTCGWKNKPDCDPSAKFLDPKGFIQYLKMEVGRPENLQEAKN
jgi:hypothetical protein